MTSWSAAKAQEMTRAELLSISRQGRREARLGAGAPL